MPTLTAAEPAAATATWGMLARVQVSMLGVSQTLKARGRWMSPRVRKEVRRHLRRLERIEFYLIDRISERNTP